MKFSLLSEIIIIISTAGGAIFAIKELIIKKENGTKSKFNIYYLLVFMTLVGILIGAKFYYGNSDSNDPSLFDSNGGEQKVTLTPIKMEYDLDLQKDYYMYLKDAGFFDEESINWDDVNSSLSRVEMICLLSELYQKEIVAKEYAFMPLFDDLDYNSPYVSYIGYADAMGWISASMNESFNGDQILTREEVNYYLLNVLSYNTYPEIAFKNSVMIKLDDINNDQFELMTKGILYEQIVKALHLNSYGESIPLSFKYNLDNLSINDYTSNYIVDLYENFESLGIFYEDSVDWDHFDEYITKAEIICLLDRLKGKHLEAEVYAFMPSYPDLEEFNPLTPYIAFAESAGWVLTPQSNNFDPDSILKRNEVNCYLLKALNYDVNVEDSFTISVSKGIESLENNEHDYMTKAMVYKVISRILVTPINNDTDVLGDYIDLNNFDIDNLLYY